MFGSFFLMRLLLCFCCFPLCLPSLVYGASRYGSSCCWTLGTETQYAGLHWLICTVGSWCCWVSCERKSLSYMFCWYLLNKWETVTAVHITSFMLNFELVLPFCYFLLPCSFKWKFAWFWLPLTMSTEISQYPWDLIICQLQNLPWGLEVLRMVCMETVDKIKSSMESFRWLWGQYSSNNL